MRRGPGQVAAGLLVANVIGTAAILPPTAQVTAPTALFELYSTGQYAEFDSTISRQSPADRVRFKDFSKSAEAWIKAEPSERRRLVATIVALEFAYLLRDEPADRSAEFLIWASVKQEKNARARPGRVERLWHLAALAGMQALAEPWVLATGGPATGVRMAELADSMPTGGQLAVAQARFPGEPRFALAAIDATADDATFDWGFVPEVIEFERKVAGMPVSSAPQSRDEIEAVGFRDNAVRALARRNQVEKRIAEYRALESSDLQADLAVRIGRLQAGSGQWQIALATLEPVRRTPNSYLSHLAELLVGRIRRSMGDHAGAIESLQRSLDLVPKARTASTLLAAELIMTGSQDGRLRANSLLREAHGVDAPEDPARLFQHGDAYLWPRYIAELREAIK